MRGFIVFLVSVALVSVAPLLFFYGDSLGVFAFLYSATVFPGMLCVAGWKLFWKRRDFPQWSMVRMAMNAALLVICGLLIFFAYLWYIVSNSF